MLYDIRSRYSWRGSTTAFRAEPECRAEENFVLSYCRRIDPTLRTAAFQKASGAKRRGGRRPEFLAGVLTARAKAAL
jgi:hypothetical protein